MEYCSGGWRKFSFSKMPAGRAGVCAIRDSAASAGISTRKAFLIPLNPFGKIEHAVVRERYSIRAIPQ